MCTFINNVPSIICMKVTLCTFYSFQIHNSIIVILGTRFMGLSTPICAYTLTFYLGNIVLNT